MRIKKRENFLQTLLKKGDVDGYEPDMELTALVAIVLGPLGKACNNIQITYRNKSLTTLKTRRKCDLLTDATKARNRNKRVKSDIPWRLFRGFLL
jgi:hypothetical protein